MAERLVQCVKLKRELPGLDHPPFSGELGERIYQNVSQEAWAMYREHLKMVINEYRLTLGTQEANEMIERHTEDYFFGPGASLPPRLYSSQDRVAPFQGRMPTRRARLSTA